MKFDRKPNKNAEIFDYRNWLQPRAPCREWANGQLKNRQTENWMMGDLYAKGFNSSPQAAQWAGCS
jgi:hypothetical protein